MLALARCYTGFDRRAGQTAGNEPLDERRRRAPERRIEPQIKSDAGGEEGAGETGKCRREPIPGLALGLSTAQELPAAPDPVEAVTHEREGEAPAQGGPPWSPIAPAHRDRALEPRGFVVNRSLGGRVEAVVGINPVHGIEDEIPAHAAKQIVVEHQILARIERPGPLPRLARPKDRRLREPVAEPDRQHPFVADKGRRVLDAEKAVILVNETAASHHHMPARSGVDLARDALERARLERVVGIEEGQDVAGRAREALVDGIGLTAVGLANDDEMAETGEDRRGLVGGEPVDDDVLEVRVVLVAHALDGALDKRALIEGRSDDGNARPADSAAVRAGHLDPGRTSRARTMRCGHYRHVEGRNSGQSAPAPSAFDAGPAPDG